MVGAYTVCVLCLEVVMETPVESRAAAVDSVLVEDGSTMSKVLVEAVEKHNEVSLWSVLS